MQDDRIQIEPPLYMAYTTFGCWRCGADMPVVALIAPCVPAAEGEICVLSDIDELPSSVLSFVTKRFPTFKLKYSKAADSQYYANTCPKCGVLSGDFYLHSEPGAPFFPTTAEEAKAITLETIPLRESISVRAGLGLGVGDLILENARRIDAEPGATGDPATRAFP